MKLQAVVRVVFMSVGLLVAIQGSAGERVEPPDPLRDAIQDLTATFGTRYPHGAEYLARWDRIRREREQATGEQATRWTAELEQLRREALLANPLLSSQPLLFVVRHQYRPDHHNTETMFQTSEINTGSFQGPGALKTIDWAHGGEVKTLFELPDGVARDPDVSFDGQKILFSLRRNLQDVDSGDTIPISVSGCLFVRVSGVARRGRGSSPDEPGSRRRRADGPYAHAPE